MLEEILICPQTGNRITIDIEHNIAKVNDSDISYPIKSEIIDFIPDTADRISKAYDSIAPSYDDYANLSTLSWILFSLIVWGFLDDKPLIEKMLSPIPDDFEGVLLDVPVGTGILTINKYKKLKKAKIIAIDYSFEMLKKAQHSYTENGIENVTFIRADVGNLPIQRSSIDLCLSSGGFHVFSNKEKALSEIARVLKANAIFTGAFFIKGKRLITDLFARLILARKGYFTPPFYNEQDAISQFSEYFKIECSETLKSCFLFTMNKKN